MEKMNDDIVLINSIHELLHFLPKFDRSDRDLIERWGGGESLPDGSITMPFPLYAKEVKAFIKLASQDYWCDYEYIPTQAGEMISDDAFIATASLAQIKTMLTYVVRGERFCEGHWNAMIQSGRVAALLKRLQAIQAAG
jgi:Family of unknown function (DUF6508)